MFRRGCSFSQVRCSRDLRFDFKLTRVFVSDENHWVLKPANLLKWYEEVLGWISKHGLSDEEASETTLNTQNSRL